MDILRIDRIEDPEKKIKEIVERIKGIRELVKNGTEAKQFFGEYYELTCNLRIVDKDNPELDISIHGKPYAGI